MAEVSVLIVDDEASIGLLIHGFLTDEGHAAIVARDGQESLIHIQRQRFDIILLDLQMPVMDGRSFYRALRALLNDSPVVIMSAHDAEAARLELGAQASIAKPFDLEELLGHIERLGAKSR